MVETAKRKPPRVEKKEKKAPGVSVPERQGGKIENEKFCLWGCKKKGIRPRPGRQEATVTKSYSLKRLRKNSNHHQTKGVTSLSRDEKEKKKPGSL